MTKKAYLLIRPLPHYRREVFNEGLKCIGFTVEHSRPSFEVTADDLLIIWNRYGHDDNLAKLFKKRGAQTIVVENGYLDMKDTKKVFAISLDYHNGAGGYPDLTHDRASLLDIDVKPWRRVPGQILLLPQRGIGCPNVAMPGGWLEATKRTLQRRDVRVRYHPGTADKLPIERDLEGVASVVTWASGAAIKAIVEGVPAFHGLPSWIAREGAAFGCNVDRPVYPDRSAMLERIAWAQWTCDEVRTGEPFVRLLESNATREHKS